MAQNSNVIKQVKITNTIAERNYPEGLVTTIWDSETKGFGLRVSPNGKTRTYFIQFRVKGSKQERLISIGRHNDPYRVDQARAKAVQIKAEMLAGVDPVIKAKETEIERKRKAADSEAKTITLREVMQHYLINKRTKHGELRDTTKRDLKHHVENNLGDWADKPIASITREKCLDRYEQITNRGAASQATQCFVNLRALINHAREMFTNEEGEPLIFVTNPVSRMFKIRKPNPEKARTSRIPLDKIGAVWLALQKRRLVNANINDRTSVDYVQFLLLTGCRRMEAGSLKWADVNLEKSYFTLRGDVVKNHNEVCLPINSLLKDLLEQRRAILKAEEIYVFPSFGKKLPHISDARATMAVVSEVAEISLSLHDLRRSFDDIAKQQKVSDDERRQLLNHMASDVHGMSYSNNPDPKSLAVASEAVAKFIVKQVKIAEATLQGKNILRFG